MRGAEKAAVILAGGSGTRVGSRTPKQFLTIKGIPLLLWSVRAFWRADPQIMQILVLEPVSLRRWQKLLKQWKSPNGWPSTRFLSQISCVGPGATRTLSVASGLQALEATVQWVAVHDSARPLVSPVLIQKAFATAVEHGNAVPVVPVEDSLRKVVVAGGGHGQSQPVSRDEYVRVQTPQVFEATSLKKAYGSAAPRDFTDDATLMEAAGHSIHLFPGDTRNFKVTFDHQLALARALAGNA